MDSILIIVALVVGFFLRDISIKKLYNLSHRGKQALRKTGDTGKSTVISYKPEKTIAQETSEKARSNIQKI